MAKVTLGKRPTSFTSVIAFPLLDGTTQAIECIFVYRTKTEFGQLIADISAQSVELAKDQAQQAGAADVPATMATVMAQTVEQNANYLGKILSGWNLDIPLNKANLTQLADELPAAVAAIMDGYRSACVEGRLGN